ncbi:metallophosphoesterase [Arthrobacter castelli]|uniref:metallophosphoesterase n=1 Tax=Arthrobacter castelli TaxID=271431 RepID=UPI001FE07CED|nr:metallophosphoesterase [Arthrobacter castelli]
METENEMNVRKSRLRSSFILALILALGATALAVFWSSVIPPSFTRDNIEPLPKEPGQITFTASGDFGAGESAQSVFEQIGTVDPALHLALGDFSYGETDTEQQWCSMVTDVVGQTFPFQLIAGDHELNGEDGDLDTFTDCLPNQLPGLEGNYGRQWYADVPREDPLVRLVMISPGLDFGSGPASYQAGSQRYQWTAEAIAGAREESIPWVVVGMHAPCLSMGEYGCTPGADITNLMLKKDVDLVLHGDEHLYQRTKQLALTQECPRLRPETYSPACVADDDANLAAGGGTVFVTAGTGGRDLRDVHLGDPEAPYFAASAGANKNPTHGNLHIRVTDEALTGRFLPASGGDFTDNFSIERR